ncbi:MAG: PadR family transcriptional regulator [Phycisphaerales bacterium]|jgi:PadR family transcriptional regulator PadR|nr:PadR family transcriptional regulator [Phycisphaerales bacterium]
MDALQDMVKGGIVPVVLALLGERAMYGYEIVKLVDARSGGKLRWKEGTLYPTLHRLEAEGKLRAEWQDAPGAEGGGRRRKYYALTRSGRTELKRRLQEWEQFTGSINAVLKGGVA